VISVRFMMALLAFFGYAVQYIQRIDMSVAIVCMVNNTALKARAAAAATNAIASTTAAYSLEGASFNASESAAESVPAATDMCLFKELAKGKSLVSDTHLNFTFV
jgi:hypothetical protein